MFSGSDNTAGTCLGR